MKRTPSVVPVALSLALALGGYGCSSCSSPIAEEGGGKQATEIPTTTDSAKEPQEEAAPEVTEVDYPRTGVTYTLPQELTGGHRGQLDLENDRGEVPYGCGVAWAYGRYIPRTADEAAEMNAFEESLKSGTLSADDVAAKVDEYGKDAIDLYQVFAIKESYTYEEGVANLRSGYGFEGEVFEGVTEPVALGSAGGYNFFAVFADLNSPACAEVLSRYPEDMRQELSAIMDAVVAHPENFSVKRPDPGFSATAVGTKIEFETTDLDGNPVKSSDIFSQHKATMVSIWKTGCVPCIAEFPDYEELNARYGEEGGAVITTCADAVDDETKATAKRDTEGFTFLTLGPLSEADSVPGSPDAILSWSQNPTSYFVDSEGVVVAGPIVGGYTEKYYQAFDELLGTTTERPASSSSSGVTGTSTYSVRVTDQNGDPVAGATVAFSNDSVYETVVTDAGGFAHYDSMPLDYHVTVVSLPEGYSAGEMSEGYAERGSGNLEIVVAKGWLGGQG